MNLIVLIISAIGVWVAWVYNRLTMLRNRHENQWNQIDVMLKRRHDLTKQLETVVKAYTDFEAQTLERVTKARTTAEFESDPAKMAKTEGELSSALASMFVVAENYPQLKANALAGQLMEQLTQSEEQIRFDRQFYNDCVLKYENFRRSFPTVMIAGGFGFREGEYFGEKSKIEN